MRLHWATLARCLLCFAGLAAALNAPAAEPADQVANINIPAQPMQEALNEFARQTGLQIVVRDTDVPPGLVSTPVSGLLTAASALDKLLTSSGLNYQFLNPRTVAIRVAKPAPKSSSRTPPPLHLAQSESASSSDVADAGVSAGALQEVVVTAQKRVQSANDVGMSITAITQETLAQRGIRDIFDLAREVPGLSVSPSGQGPSVVYTLRGVGFNSQNLSASPTVSVSVDEVPLPYPAMTEGAALDLARVEILKGPQGTLFGQNSTGGQINYIAAKPTNALAAGVEASYGRFNWWDIKGYVSGPASDTLKMRLAVSHEGGDGWQRSESRDATLGSPNRSAGRFIAQWEPLEQLRVAANFNIWQDKSDSQAVQFVRYTPSTPPGLPKYQVLTGAPRDNRAADWDPDKRFKLDSTFYQPSLRVDYDLAQDVTLTSISAYSDYKTNNLFETDGTQYENIAYGVLGYIRSFSQELRLAGSHGPLHWIVGGNYSRDKIAEQQNAFIHDYSSTQNIGGSGVGAIFSPAFSKQTSHAEAAFTNLEYALSEKLTIVGGARYTKTTTDYRGCNLASGPPVPNEPIPGVVSSLTMAFNNLYHAVTGNFGLDPVTEDGCITLDDVHRNGAPPTFLPTDSQAQFSEHNVAWNGTVNFKPNRDTLVYARVAKGYKSGGFPTQGATLASQEAPFRQESILAYEAGFKVNLRGTLQLDGAAFYYDYKDKQLSGYIISVFGPLQQTVNVPKSDVKGAELAVSYAPLPGLTLSAATTYLETEIKQYVGIDVNAGGLRDFAGAALSFAPKWSGTAGVEYRKEIRPQLFGTVGIYDSVTSASTGVLGSENPDFTLWGYNLVDVHVGLESERWTAQIWGKNVFDRAYSTNAFRLQDQDIRVMGLPATYGLRFGYRF